MIRTMPLEMVLVALIALIGIECVVDCTFSCFTTDSVMKFAIAQVSNSARHFTKFSGLSPYIYTIALVNSCGVDTCDKVARLMILSSVGTSCQSVLVPSFVSVFGLLSLTAYLSECISVLCRL